MAKHKFNDRALECSKYALTNDICLYCNNCNKLIKFKDMHDECREKDIKS